VCPAADAVGHVPELDAVHGMTIREIVRLTIDEGRLRDWVETTGIWNYGAMRD